MSSALRHSDQEGATAGGQTPPTMPPTEEHGERDVLQRRDIRYVAVSRKGQFIRALPVVFVVLLITALYIIFVLFHCIPLLQLELPPEQRVPSRFSRGLGELIAFNILTVLLLLSYGLAVFVPPGEIPDSDEWLYPPALYPSEENEMIGTVSAETKRTGERRFCKWCGKYKPDRAHHCRVCRRCVLKMDHHCPWIFNCVGWGNHKYFMLSLIYSVITTAFIAAAMFESVKRAVEQPVTPFGEMFLLLFGETLDVFLGVIVTGFFAFHLWLMSNGMTTIEFCEKQFRWRTSGESLWNRGCCNNFRDVFGSNPLLWFLPYDNREGNGVSFVCERSPLLLDEDSRQNSGRKRVTRRKKGKPSVEQFDPVVDGADLEDIPS